MPRAIRVHRTGGPEVLTVEDVDPGQPAQGELLIRQTAAGVNFIDVYHRTGLYKLPLPFTPGMEGAGVVEAVGPGVTDLNVGDRIAYGGGPGTIGGYAQLRRIPADRVVKVPEGVDDQRAASIMLKGLTAQYLLRQTYQVKRGDTILFHAAAGGVGLIACQWAKSLGATVIGTTGSDEKAALARDHGCDHVIVYTRENFAERVRAITGGRGVPVVYDSVGKDTFAGSLDCLQPRGMMVLFGQSSGVVPPFELNTLAAKGSLYVTRPTINNYADTKESLRAMAADLFAQVTSGAVRIQPPRTMPLDQVAEAHVALEGRRTTGSTVLLP
jgi:NADPH:quinone reductase